MSTQNFLDSFKTFSGAVTIVKQIPDVQFGNFTYDDNSQNFTNVARQNLQHIEHQYGVYLIKSINKDEVIYIGKAGTVDKSKKLTNQNILGRLINTRSNNVTSNTWFGKLFEKYGPFVVEYIIVQLPLTPAFVESFLLQAYFCENGFLPKENKEL